MALENFTTYTTVDTFSQLTVTANNITQNNGDCQNPAYVYKDEGGVYFGDFTHKFTIVLSRGSGSPFLAHWAIANNVASLYQLTQYIYMDAFYAVGHWELGYYDSGAHHAGTGFAVPDGTYYVTVIRTGLTTILFNIYSDSARTILVYTFGGTCINTTFRYVYGFNNYGNNTFIGLNSNQTQDLNLTGAYTDWTKSLSDSQGSSDALTKKVGKSLSDSQGSSDALTKKVAKPLSDSVSESDGIILNIGKGITLSDSISESDSIMKDSIKDLNDGVSESDAITKENAKSLSDSVTVIDTEVSNLELTLTENVSVNEALVKGVRKLFSDSVVPTDVEVPVLSYYTYPAYDATMPILLSMYRNVTARFTTLYNSIAYGLFYSLARAITQLAEIDWVTAMKQMNIKTATNNFLALWGSYFGAKRYSGESDFAYSSRIIKRVTAPRNIESAILDAVLSVGGVFFAEIKEQLAGSMFIGYSYIGFDGAPGYEQMSDFISGGIGETPFFFVVFVKIKKNTNFRAILDAINDNRAGGMNYVVQILEEI
jgi:hypothetical protein